MIRAAAARVLRVSSANRRSERWVSAAGTHDGSYPDDPHLYVQRVLNFVAFQIAERGAAVGVGPSPARPLAGGTLSVSRDAVAPAG